MEDVLIGLAMLVGGLIMLAGFCGLGALLMWLFGWIAFGEDAPPALRRRELGSDWSTVHHEALEELRHRRP